jgi:hypothetical protein
MPKQSPKVRKWIKNLPLVGKMPGIIWALAIDSTDLVVMPFGTLLTYLGLGVGLLVTQANNIFQIILAYAIFDDPVMWIGGGGSDALLPDPFNLFPSFTAIYLAEKEGILN